MKRLFVFISLIFLILLDVNCAKKLSRDEEIAEANRKAEDLYRSGQNYRVEKRYWKARRKLNKVVNDYPESDYGDLAAFEIAEIFKEAKKYWRAYEKYQVVADTFPSSKLMPRVSEEQINIGDYYWDKDKKYEAVEIYKKALENYPFGDKAADTQYRVAGYYFEYAENYRGLFKSVYKEENFNEAILEYKKALNNYPNHPLKITAKYRLGLANYYCSLPWSNDQTITDEAISNFQELAGEKEAKDLQDDIDEKLKILFEKKARSECSIGDFYLKQNQIQSARIYYEKVIEKDFSKIWTGHAYFGLGETYWKEKNTDKAKVYYDKVLSEYPKSKDAKTIEKRFNK